MNPEQYNVLAEAFQKACELHGDLRNEFLDKFRSLNPDLHSHLVALLKEDESKPDVFADDRLDREFAKLEKALDEGIETGRGQEDVEEVGPYRILRVLGEGGMGNCLSW